MNLLERKTPLFFLLLIVVAGTHLHLRKTREKIRHRLDKVEVFEAHLHGMEPPQKSAGGKTPRVQNSGWRLPAAENKKSVSANKSTERPVAEAKPLPSRRALFSLVQPNLTEFCRAGDEDACQMLDAGPAGRQLYRYTCAIAAKGCLPAAEAEERSGDPQLASQQFRTACLTENLGEACLRHLYLLESFNGAGFDDRMEYFTLACDQRLAEGCFHLAELYMNLGHPELHDHYYRTACQLNPSADYPLCPQLH